MKHITRLFVFHLVALWIVNQLNPGLVIANTLLAFLTAAFVLSMLMLIVKPLLTILFIPINVLTFGLLSWLVHVIVLYLLTLFVPSVEVLPWQFPGASFVGFTIPPFSFTYFLSLIAASLSITFITNLLEELT